MLNASHSPASHADLPNRWLGVVVCGGATFLAAAAGSVASLQAREFYAQLTRPSWAPPGWLFGPVWTALFIAMAIAAMRIWRSPRSPERSQALGWYLTQLVLNGLWTWVFFAWRSGLWATIEIAVLWLMIGATFLSFRRLRPAAAWLLVPYWIWVTFAAALTVACWRLNPDLL